MKIINKPPRLKKLRKPFMNCNNLTKTKLYGLEKNLKSKRKNMKNSTNLLPKNTKALPVTSTSERKERLNSNQFFLFPRQRPTLNLRTTTENQVLLNFT